MIHKLILSAAFSMLFCVLSNAQNNVPSALDQLAIQCQQVIALNDSINARQSRLDELKGQLDVIKQNWWQTCNDALSSPDCDENETRLSTIDELIRLTDPKFEADILSQLNEAKSNATIRTLKSVRQPMRTSGRDKSSGQRNTSGKETTQPIEQSTMPGQRTGDESDIRDNDEKGNKDKEVMPVSEEQPKNEQRVKKDNSSTSPETKDSKKNPEKQVAPEQQGNKEKKDKTKIESKDETNRNKTINAVKDKLNKNK